MARPHSGGLLSGWRGLGLFWAGMLSAAAVGGGILTLLGPPDPSSRSVRAIPPGVPVVHADPLPSDSRLAETKPANVVRSDPSAIRPGRPTAGPIADPDPSLQEPYPGDAHLTLPRISLDGRAPMAVYAAGFDPSSLRPRVGLLIAGIGMSEAVSLSAIKDLPGGVTLAVSPYAGDIGHLLDAARMSEHEYLLAIPMEPQGYPVNDPDDRHALMTSLAPAENLDRLRWALSRLTGYVGVTTALGQMHGERLAGMPDQFGPVLEEVAHRGLLFVDARTGQLPAAWAWNRPVDLTIDDDPEDADALDRRLDALTHLALDKGSALGLVSLPRPVALARVAAWTNTLVAKGLALAPVSALVLPPAKQDTGK